MYLAPAYAHCGGSAVSLSFGGYNEFATAPTDSIGNVTVTCLGNKGTIFAYSIALSPGGSGTFSTRRMRSAASPVPLTYNLYTTAARTTVWGDGNGGSMVVSDAYTLGHSQVTRNYSVYGRVFARQKVPVGTYTDYIVVTFNF
jgi:spore coat protein U-like protein